MQDNYKVNAVFTMAVALTESGGGTNWAAISSDTYNWMSLRGSYNGNSYKSSDGRDWRTYTSFGEATEDFGDLIANSSYYFQNQKFDVDAIAPTYCNEEWGTRVNGFMNDFYATAGIDVGTSDGTKEGTKEGTESTDPQTGATTITFTNGKTYTNYKQIIEDYKEEPLANYEYDFPNTNLYEHGCAIVSVTIIATGFGNDVTPMDVNNYYKTLDDAYHETGLNHYTNMTCKYHYSNIKDGVIEQLKRGYPVFVHVGANEGTFETTSGHFFTILAISEAEDQVYVSDPASNGTDRNGWLPITILDDTAFNQYIKME